MNSDDKALMEDFGITEEIKSVFHFDGRRYERLSDAVSYARLRRYARRPDQRKRNSKSQ